MTRPAGDRGPAAPAALATREAVGPVGPVEAVGPVGAPGAVGVPGAVRALPALLALGAIATLGDAFCPYEPSEPMVIVDVEFAATQNQMHVRVSLRLFNYLVDTFEELSVSTRGQANGVHLIND